MAFYRDAAFGFERYVAHFTRGRSLVDPSRDHHQLFSQVTALDAVLGTDHPNIPIYSGVATNPPTRAPRPVAGCVESATVGTGEVNRRGYSAPICQPPTPPKLQCESGRPGRGSSRPRLRTPASAGHSAQSSTGRDTTLRVCPTGRPHATHVSICPGESATRCGSSLAIRPFSRIAASPKPPNYSTRAGSATKTGRHDAGGSRVDRAWLRAEASPGSGNVGRTRGSAAPLRLGCLHHRVRARSRQDVRHAGRRPGG